MKRIFAGLMASMMMLSASTCAFAEEDLLTTLKEAKKDFKIAIMSSCMSQDEERYRAALQAQEMWGEDVILIDTFPEKAIAEQETTVSKVMALASDPDVKAIVLNQAESGTIAALTKVLDMRDDIFLVACNPNEDYDECAEVASVIICKDQNLVGAQFANTAVEMGAKNFVHYSFPRHMSNQAIAKRTEVMREICESNGVNFYEVSAPDPQSDAGTAGAQQFILEDVPRQIAKLGPDTVFFSTNTAMHEPIIKAMMEGHAMYVGQSDPSPFSAFPSAMNIEIPEDKSMDADYALAAIEEKVTEAGMNGRVSTWTRPLNNMYTNGAVVYALMHCLGMTNDQPGEADLDACVKAFRAIAGDGASLSYYTNNNGKTYHHVFGLVGSMYVF